MTHPVLEIVTYHTDTPAEADQQRALARDSVALLPGFQGWMALSRQSDPGQRADLVLWSGIDAAEGAARTVGQGPAFAPFRATVTTLASMGHYSAPDLALMQPGEGVELGRFRLRDGASEADLRAAHARMVATHLSRQAGWRGQRLLRLEDGSFVDLAFAASAEAAKAICAAWEGNADCDAFLALIEPVSMEFGSIA